jgi:hypothetical protein
MVMMAQQNPISNGDEGAAGGVRSCWSFMAAGRHRGAPARPYPPHLGGQHMVVGTELLLAED